MTRQASGIVLIAGAFLLLYLIRTGSLSAVLDLLKNPGSTASAETMQANQLAAEQQLAQTAVSYQDATNQAIDQAKIGLLQQQLDQLNKILADKSQPAVAGPSGGLTQQITIPVLSGSGQQPSTQQPTVTYGTGTGAPYFGG